MYNWLNGPGQQLKHPLPGSTNYLGAYSKDGRLLRAGPDWRRPEPGEAEKKPADAESEEPEDDLEMAVRRDEEKKQKQANSELPPETREDLRPFPLNTHFRSQPVLSEELREAIYNRVVNGGASVSLASVEFGVSNERVGAVVRLKQLEKQWIAEVREFFFTLLFQFNDETNQNRLVFKTTHMVTKRIAMLFLN